MPKKTRKQKIISDIRHTIHPVSNVSFSYSFTKKSTTPSNNSEIANIRKDVLKTLFLGAIIIAFELLLTANKQKLGW